MVSGDIMKVCELYAKDPSAVRFGLCVKGLATGTLGVLVPPWDDDFDATAHFFHEDPTCHNGYGHFWFSDCENEVVLDSDGTPTYMDVPEFLQNK